MDEFVDSRPGMQRLLEGVEREIDAQRARDTPANDHPGEHVDDEHDREPLSIERLCTGERR